MSELELGYAAHLEADGEELARVTVTMTKGQHRAIKRRARELGTSVSELVRTWVAEEADTRSDGD